MTRINMSEYMIPEKKNMKKLILVHSPHVKHSVDL